MSRPCKLDPTSRTLMAKAYVAGTPCSELAEHYDVSMSYVINTAKAWQTEQSLRRLKTLEKQVRQQIVPPPIEMPDDQVLSFANGIGWFTRTPRQYSMRTKNNGVVERTTFVALPYVSIQHPKGA